MDDWSSTGIGMSGVPGRLSIAFSRYILIPQYASKNAVLRSMWVPANSLVVGITLLGVLHRNSLIGVVRHVRRPDAQSDHVRLFLSVRGIPLSRTEQGIRNLVRGKNERLG